MGRVTRFDRADKTTVGIFGVSMARLETALPFTAVDATGTSPAVPRESKEQFVSTAVDERVKRLMAEKEFPLPSGCAFPVMRS